MVFTNKFFFVGVAHNACGSGFMHIGGVYFSMARQQSLTTRGCVPESVDQSWSRLT